MTLADAYRRLGTILSGLEAEGIEVSDVAPVQDDSEEVFHVDLRIGIPMAADAPEPVIAGSDNSGVPGGAAMTAGDEQPTGGVDADTRADQHVETDTDARADPASEVVAESGSDPESRDDVAYPCEAPDCTAGFDSEAARSVHRFVAHEALDEPIYRHEPALRASYEAYDSFASMTDALEADVTPQTVRRNMMKFGIHEPDVSDDSGTEAEADTDATDRDDASADAGAEPEPPAGDSAGTAAEDESGATDTDTASSPAAEEQPVTDGSGGVVAATASGSPHDAGLAGAPQEEAEHLAALPDDIAVSDLRAAVVDGGSLRAAAQRLGRSRGATRELLQEHDLLDLVHGRVATRPGPEERADAFEAWLDQQRLHTATQS